MAREVSGSDWLLLAMCAVLSLTTVRFAEEVSEPAPNPYQLQIAPTTSELHP